MSQELKKVAATYACFVMTTAIWKSIQQFKKPHEKHGWELPLQQPQNLKGNNCLEDHDFLLHRHDFACLRAAGAHKNQLKTINSKKHPLLCLDGYSCGTKILDIDPRKKWERPQILLYIASATHKKLHVRIGLWPSNLRGACLKKKKRKQWTSD